MGEAGRSFLSFLSLCAAVVGVVIAWLAWQHPKAPASPRPVPAVVSVASPRTASPVPTVVSSSAAPARTPRPTPTIRELLYSQLQVGDCLAATNLHLNTSNPWPYLVQAVPCSQGHIAEVFFADNKYWSTGGPYPGDSAIKKGYYTGCGNAFASYVGIPFLLSDLRWTAIMPGASSWSGGDRSLHCVAYFPTTDKPGGAVVYGSFKGTNR